ncbi:TnsA endonuclease N-terminal domain-containing protein [Undibacterium curvum]|uniref:Tn7 transposase TnsA N-terminal domain-containing protein n=1 Tax=Undibacterium curvum TaxID=2762294 RepID=A0ABR7A6U1_9BURK|nr:TnsA endonuclease N-terminal domain-containing protein [Undibacterium curvum]MBC3932612.1 Tn7 transposase TnsA N-terminal domain-containing protein [Undibacterium curvum]
MSEFHKPRNIVTRSGGILRGFFSSQKYNKQIKWEGSIEKDAVALFEFSAGINDVVSQPFRYSFVVNGKKTSRTADFLITTSSENILVECKPKAMLLREEVKLHLKIAKEHFEKLGYRYLIVTDQMLRSGTALANAKKLLPFRIRNIQSHLETHRIHQQLELLKSSFPFTNLREASDHLRSETDVLVMLASGLAFFDFHQAISDSTQISFSQLEKTHDAARFIFP